MVNFNSIKELIELAKENRTTIGKITMEYEMEHSFDSKEHMIKSMEDNWRVMQESIERGVSNKDKSLSGLTGGDAIKIYAHRDNSYTGKTVMTAAASAVGVSEVNAVMGRIVACPTAGSCGIVPAAIKTAAEKNNNTEEEIVDALFTAAGIGLVIEANASIAGAYGGCQAECGTAAGMAAGAMVQLAGGTPDQV